MYDATPRIMVRQLPKGPRCGFLMAVVFWCMTIYLTSGPTTSTTDLAQRESAPTLKKSPLRDYAREPLEALARRPQPLDAEPRRRRSAANVRRLALFRFGAAALVSALVGICYGAAVALSAFFRRDKEPHGALDDVVPGRGLCSCAAEPVKAGDPILPEFFLPEVWPGGAPAPPPRPKNWLEPEF